MRSLILFLCSLLIAIVSAAPDSLSVDLDAAARTRTTTTITKTVDITSKITSTVTKTRTLTSIDVISTTTATTTKTKATEYITIFAQNGTTTPPVTVTSISVSLLTTTLTLPPTTITQLVNESFTSTLDPATTTVTELSSVTTTVLTQTTQTVTACSTLTLQVSGGPYDGLFPQLYNSGGDGTVLGFTTSPPATFNLDHNGYLSTGGLYASVYTGTVYSEKAVFFASLAATAAGTGPGLPANAPPPGTYSLLTCQVLSGVLACSANGNSVFSAEAYTPPIWNLNTVATMAPGNSLVVLQAYCTC